MPKLRETLAAVFKGNRFEGIVPPLPVEDEAIVPGRLRFGLPWPWEVVPSGEVLDATGGATAVSPLVTVQAPRTSLSAAVFSVWRDQEPGTLDALLATAAEQIASLYRGRPRSVRRFSLAGARAVVVDLDTANERIHRVVAEWDSYLLHGEHRVPSAYGDAYEPHFATMLGTWRWG